MEKNLTQSTGDVQQLVPADNPFNGYAQTVNRIGKKSAKQMGSQVKENQNNRSTRP